jgi:transposase
LKNLLRNSCLGKNETGPTVGEYFLYAAYNRMIDSCSKRALPEWYQSTAVQQIRPVDVHALDSDGYWNKWDRVGEEEIRTIAEKLFARVAEIEPSRSGCFLFDTTNYYTFMASDTESELTKRGKNKEGRDWLRQVGLALLMARAPSCLFITRSMKATATIPSSSAGSWTKCLAP